MIAAHVRYSLHQLVTAFAHVLGSLDSYNLPSGTNPDRKAPRDLTT